MRDIFNRLKAAEQHSTESDTVAKCIEQLLIKYGPKNAQLEHLKAGVFQMTIDQDKAQRLLTALRSHVVGDAAFPFSKTAIQNKAVPITIGAVAKLLLDLQSNASNPLTLELETNGKIHQVTLSFSRKGVQTRGEIIVSETSVTVELTGSNTVLDKNATNSQHVVKNQVLNTITSILLT